MTYRKRVTPLALVALIALAACSKATIDTSSQDSTRDSIQEVRNSLPEADRGRFNEAIKLLMFGQTLQSGLAGQDGEEAGATAASALNGLTGQEIIARGEKVRAEREAKEREQGLAEIHELKAKKSAADAAALELQSFEVLRSRFYKQEQRFEGPKPVIELAVRNGTATAVSRAHFVGTLATPGRSVPWLKESFNYQISGGLEPGEEAEWSLAPNMFSKWGAIEEREDMVFTVEVKRLDGPDGEPFLDAQFSERDGKRLAALVERFPSKL